MRLSTATLMLTLLVIQIVQTLTELYCWVALPQQSAQNGQLC